MKMESGGIGRFQLRHLPAPVQPVRVPVRQLPAHRPVLVPVRVAQQQPVRQQHYNVCNIMQKEIL